MKLALFLLCCVLASAFSTTLARPQDDGSVDDGGAPDGGPEGLGDGPEGADGGPGGDYGDEEDDGGLEAKETDAAGHGGHHGGHHSGHHGRSGFSSARRFRAGIRIRGGYRGGYGGGGYGRREEIDHSTCSVQASYFLSFNGDRRHCRHATYDHDDCQSCCEAATRRETRGADKDDIIGFITRHRKHGERRGEYRGKREAGAGYAAAGGGGYAAAGGYGEHKEKVIVEHKREDHEWECVCCIPKKGGYGYGGGYEGGY